MFSLKFPYLILLLLFLNLLYIYNDIINDIFHEKKIEWKNYFYTKLLDQSNWANIDCLVPDQFSGVGECLASGYRGEYNYTGAQFHLFNQGVVLPCDNKELGYIYRTGI